MQGGARSNSKMLKFTHLSLVTSFRPFESLGCKVSGAKSVRLGSSAVARAVLQRSGPGEGPGPCHPCRLRIIHPRLGNRCRRSYARTLSSSTKERMIARGKNTFYPYYRVGLLSGSYVWLLNFFLLLLTTFTSTGLKNSRNLGTVFLPIPLHS